ncbi:WD repeat-containing protein 93-like [Lytechinus variegatus]|uniref:WD repeat-containing protein 93-like n=1 Tax=Lytechinus variegatus TaxID=7654 RepID=UPI001BB1DB68|nr:WD repeat-containing protein 93-like [Lytechinus variegatus]
MPVYVRKNLMSITPDTLSNLSSDDDDYATDPDQMFDKLPQPFRLVDKIVNRIFDVAWEQISAREAAAEELRNREPVPEYEHTAIAQENEDILCMAGSPDGSAVFLGLNKGLLALHATLHNPIASWEEEGAALTTIKSTQIGVQMCLVATLDANDVCRLFCFSGSALLLLKTFDSEIPSNAHVVAMHLSRDGDYIALTLEKGDKDDNTESWIDVFKLPRDNWVRDVEAAIAKQQQQQPGHTKSTEDLSNAQEGTGDGSQSDAIEYSHPMEGLSMPSNRPKSVTSQDTPRTVTPTAAVTVPQTGASTTAPEWNPASLSKPTTLLRVKPLPDQLSAASSVPHPGQPTPASEEWCSTVGQGSRHLIQSEHLNTRRLAADQVLGPYTDPKYHISEKKPCRAKCLFVKPGLMLASANAAPINQDQAHIFIASWSNSTNICLYNLLKTAKDLEHKPDQVWPNAGKTTSMTTTPCTSLIALGLEDGSIALWDKHLSIPLMASKVFSRPICHLHILPPPPTKGITSPGDRLEALKAKPEIAVLVGDSNGDLATVCCCYGDKPTVKPVYRGTWRDRRDGACHVAPVVTLRDTTLLVTKFGDIYLCNVFTGKKLCLVKLPESTILKCDNEKPVISLAAAGQMLFVRGEKARGKNNAADGAEAENDLTFDPKPTVYAYGMHSFACLTNLWRTLDDVDTKAPTLLHTTQAKGRFDILFSNRLNEQQSRQVRMQDRWNALKQKAANRTR